MAVTFRASTSANTGSTPASSLTINVPTGTTVGDVLIAAINVDGGTGATVTTPSGWTAEGQSNEGTNQGMVNCYRIATASEPASYTFTFDTARSAAGGMLAYSGAYPYPANTSAVSTATASTTVTRSQEPAARAGKHIYLFGTRNTTGVSTMSTGTQGTARIDTCTTATPFIEFAVQEGTQKTFPPMRSTDLGAPTATQTVSQITKTMFLGDSRGSVATLDDDWWANSSFNTARTGQDIGIFKTSQQNMLVLVGSAIRTGTTTVSSVTSGGVSGFTRAARANTQAGSAEFWYGIAPNSNVAITPHLNYSASTTTGGEACFGLSGVDLVTPIGATTTVGFTGGVGSASLVTTRNNSLVVAIINTDTTTTPPGSATGFSQYFATGDGTSVAAMSMSHGQITKDAGTTVTYAPTNLAAGSSGNICLVEVLPALSKPGMSMSGVF